MTKKAAADRVLLSMLSAAGFDTDYLPQTYTVDGIPLAGNVAALVGGSATLAPDSPVLTRSSHMLSLANGGALVVDGHTAMLDSPGFFGS